MTIKASPDITYNREGRASTQRQRTPGDAAPAGTLGRYLDDIGVALGFRTGPMDPQTAHAAISLLVAAAVAPPDSPLMAPLPRDAPPVVLERALGRLASLTIGRTIELTPTTTAALDVLLLELACPKSIDT